MADNITEGNFEKIGQKEGEFTPEQMQYMQSIIDLLNKCGSCGFRTPGGKCTGAPPAVVPAPQTGLIAPGSKQPTWMAILPSVAMDHPACALYDQQGMARQMSEMALRYTYHPELLSDEEKQWVLDMQKQQTDK